MQSSDATTKPVSESQLKTTIPAGYDVNPNTQASAKKGKYEKLFKEDDVKELNITVDENNWNYLLQHANKEPYVLADSVSIGGDSVDYVGLNFKTIIDNFKNGKLGAVLQEQPVEQPFYTYDQYKNSCTPFANIINQRTVAVINQVYDDTTKVGDLGISMSTMGFTSGGWGWHGQGGNSGGTEPWPIPEIKDSVVVLPSPSPSVKPSPTPSVRPSPNPSTVPSASSVKVALSSQTEEGSNAVPERSLVFGSNK